MKRMLMVVAAAMTAAVFALPAGADSAGPPWGPETPNFNLEVVLRDVAGGPGFGLVKFRQPNDADKIVYLDTWVRKLAPDHDYLLQRAVDGADGNCTSTVWLTLGHGTTLPPQPIRTEGNGSGRESLFRSVPSAPGSQFDIHFQVIDADDAHVVLESGCYQYAVSI
jgi:hypothetical protein